MKKQLLGSCFSLLFTSIVVGGSGTVSAHVLKENNGVSAVLHIPPDDNPIAAHLTSLDFSFSSDAGSFSLEDCDCRVKVFSDGTLVQTVQLARPIGGGTLDAAASVDFPTIGVYDVIVTGNSKDAKFKSFSLDYLERVATAANAAATKTNNGGIIALLAATSFVLLGMGAYVAIRNGARY